MLLAQGSQSWDQNQEFEDIFSQFFGGGAGARGGFGGFSGGFGGFGGAFRAKGPDIHARIRCESAAPCNCHACLIIA